MGPQRLDYHFARLMWLIANMMRNGDDALPLTDFMPFVERDEVVAGTEIAPHPAVAMFEQMYAKFHEND